MTSALAMRRRAMGKGGPLVSDSFNRADSTTTMGVADTGQAWVPNSGTWGIIGNRAYNPSGTSQATTVVDAGVSDCTIKVTLIVSGDAGFCARSTDDFNNWILNNNAGDLYKRVAGAFTLVGSGGAGANGDALEVVLAGSSWTVKRNAAQIISVTDAFNSTATKHGLRTYINTTARFDNFEVTVP